MTHQNCFLHYLLYLGKFHIIGKNGRLEKSIDAHRGAVLVGKWSTDGSSLLTGMLLKLYGIFNNSNLKVASDKTKFNYIIKQVYQQKHYKIKTYSFSQQIIEFSLHLLKRKCFILKNLGGEDGQIKIWSRSGMLRSTIVQEATPIYSATWSPDSNQILFTSNKMLVIKSLTGSVKSNRVCCGINFFIVSGV